MIRLLIDKSDNSDNKESQTLKTDYALGFFGLIMQLGPIANWGLNLDKKTINVDTEKNI